MGTPARPTGIGFVWFFLLNAGERPRRAQKRNRRRDNRIGPIGGNLPGEGGAWELVM